MTLHTRWWCSYIYRPHTQETHTQVPPTLALPVLIHFCPRHCFNLERLLLGYHLVLLRRKMQWSIYTEKLEDCNTDRTTVTHSTSGNAGHVLGHRVLQPRHNLTQLPDSAHTKTHFDAHAWREGNGTVCIHSGCSQDILTFTSFILNLPIFCFFNLTWYKGRLHSPMAVPKCKAQHFCKSF